MPIDDSELRKLQADIASMPVRAMKAAEAVMKRGAQNVKDDMVADARGSRHFRPVADSISYDERRTLSGVEFEIGPDKDRAPGGPLGNIAYFGTSRGGGGTLDIDGPLDRETPRLEANLARVLGDVL